MRTHLLKTHPYFWDAMADGRKRFEFRRDDRNFARGDILLLERFDSEQDEPSPTPAGGIYLVRVVGFILSGDGQGGDVGLPAGFVVMDTSPADNFKVLPSGLLVLGGS